MSADQLATFLEEQGLSDESIDDFLEHFGAKGMKWGVRKERQSSDSEKSSDGPSNTKRNLKIAGGVAVAVGAIFLASRSTAIRGMSKTAVSSGKKFAVNQLKKQGKTKTKTMNTLNVSKLSDARKVMAEIQKKQDVSKALFDKELSTRENSQGYRYQGER